MFLLVRDDGSTDNTVEILKTWERRFPSQVNLIEGANVGYKRSFMMLLGQAPSCFDYYAFSDQDDVWLPDKLATAISKLHDDKPRAYCSKAIYVDNQLGRLDGVYSNLDELPTGSIKAEWAISTGLVALGCTMVWNKQMQDIIQKGDLSDVELAHDGFLSVFAPLVGELYKDDSSNILYRQHRRNTSGEKVSKKKVSFARIFHNMTNGKGDDHNFRLRAFVMKNYSEYIIGQRYNLINDSVKYRKSMTAFLRMLLVHMPKELNGKERSKYIYFLMSHKM